MPTMPTLFISHGMPSLLLTTHPARRFLSDIGARLPRPAAVICISPHWEAWRPMVTGAEHPETVHDFYGFPPALYEMHYPAPGHPDLCRDIARRMAGAGFDLTIDTERGFDHGAWVPLRLMFPDADTPVVQVSVQTTEGPGHHLDLGDALSDFRDQGVLILASGGAAHNLADMAGRQLHEPPPRYVRRFDDWLEETIRRGRIDDLLNYTEQAPHALDNHPAPGDHLLPLFVAQGAAGRDAAGRRLHSSFAYGVLSMAGFLWE